MQVLKIASVNGLTPWPKFMPMAIPEDLAASIQRFHSYPAVWWLGQLVKFLIRPQDEFLKNIKERERMQNFKHPVVGYALTIIQYIHTVSMEFSCLKNLFFNKF